MKDLDIALLRQHLRIVARRQARGPPIPRWQKLPLAVLASRLKAVSETLKSDALLFKPETLLRWHRELVRRKRNVLEEYFSYYNTRRPHQGLDQNAPAGLDPPELDQPIRYRKVLGRIIRNYYRAAA